MCGKFNVWHEAISVSVALVSRAENVHSGGELWIVSERESLLGENSLFGMEP